MLYSSGGVEIGMSKERMLILDAIDYDDKTSVMTALYKILIAVGFYIVREASASFKLGGMIVRQGDSFLLPSMGPTIPVKFLCRRCWSKKETLKCAFTRHGRGQSL